jgi:hypothetical protein
MTGVYERSVREGCMRGVYDEDERRARRRYDYTHHFVTLRATVVGDNQVSTDERERRCEGGC